jgi:acyl-CoA thioesterase FadM
MARVKLKFPIDNILFTAKISVRIGDINYGGHVGNDAILSIIHEARVEMLASKGYDEMNAGGNSLIMADVMIAYKGEAFYGDILTVNIYAEDITQHTFDLLYDISTVRNGEHLEIAHAKTGMVCFYYDTKKIATMTDALKALLLKSA